MCTWLKKTFIILSAATFLLISDHCYSQDSSQVHPSYKLVTAGVQYSTSEKHQKRWGEHYRKEWSTPVQVKVVMLDTLAGGVKPYEEGGGRQSRTLCLHHWWKCNGSIRMSNRYLVIGNLLDESTMCNFR